VFISLRRLELQAKLRAGDEPQLECFGPKIERPTAGRLRWGFHAAITRAHRPTARWPPTGTRRTTGTQAPTEELSAADSAEGRGAGGDPAPWPSEETGGSPHDPMECRRPVSTTHTASAKLLSQDNWRAQSDVELLACLFAPVTAMASATTTEVRYE